jgi:ectoine hydroxylase-related dioxygenase (phytanoyl-CoA dioxygenase family)
MQSTFTGIPVPGKKGDIVLWLQTLPHAASANHSDLPRFVQYISFSKC